MDVTKPTDSEIVSALPSYIRETRAFAQALSLSGLIVNTSITVLGGSNSLDIPTQLSLAGYETVFLDASGPVNLEYIYGGIEGQVKILIFKDNDFVLVDGIQSGGRLYLNQLPALSALPASMGDVLALVNVGGNGTSIDGYWKELYRQQSVR